MAEKAKSAAEKLTERVEAKTKAVEAIKALQSRYPKIFQQVLPVESDKLLKAAEGMLTKDGKVVKEKVKEFHTAADELMTAMETKKKQYQPDKPKAPGDKWAALLIGEAKKIVAIVEKIPELSRTSTIEVKKEGALLNITGGEEVQVAGAGNIPNHGGGRGRG